jgi:hypothetical protein
MLLWSVMSSSLDTAFCIFSLVAGVLVSAVGVPSKKLTFNSVPLVFGLLFYCFLADSSACTFGDTGSSVEVIGGRLAIFFLLGSS